MVNFLVLFSTLAFGAISNPDRAIVERGRNILDNGGFESGRAKWTASAGSFSTTSTAANVFAGSIAGSWDSNSAAQTLTTTIVSVNGLAGTNGEATCYIQVPSGTATHTMGIWDGSTLSQTQTLVNTSTNYVANTINFVFPSSGSIGVRFTSVNANEPSINIDKCYIGPATNLGQISQASLVGSATIAASACTPTRTSTSLGAFSTDADCPGPTIITNPGPGVIQNTDTDLPRFTFNNLPAGNYVATASFTGNQSGTVDIQTYAISDGTTTGGAISGSANSTRGTYSLSRAFTYTSSGNRSFDIYGASTAGNVVIDASDTSLKPITFTLYRYPSSSEIVYSAEVRNWRVDANISGANPSLGTSNVSSYTGIENGSLTLTNNSGVGVLSAQIPCSSTNAPSGTTCSVGNESVGVSFNLPTSGDVLACASFGNLATQGAAGDISATFQIVETPSNAQTISQEGKGRAFYRNNQASQYGGAPQRLCGTFTFTSAGQKTLRLMYEQLVSGTVSGHSIIADAGATYGQSDIHWEVYPISQGLPLPFLVGQISSNTSGQERVERASVTSSCGSTPCTIASQSGSWLTSITRSSAGTYLANFSSAFSSAPACTCSSTVSQNRFCSAQSATTTSVSILMADQTNVLADSAFNLICMGSR